VLFNSFQFLIFFPCVIILYYVLPLRYRNWMLLVASYYFYMCWKPEYIVLILFSTAMNYFFGLQINVNADKPRLKKTIFIIVIIVNIAFLVFFKYLNFFGGTITAICRAFSIPFSAPTLNIILPVGISFYTFQTMSYSIDVYKGKIEPERNFLTFALFVSFFPQLVAGPIEQASNLLPQLKQSHKFSYENISYGLKLMAWGFFKKMVIADRLAAFFVDPVYQNLNNYSGGVLIVATVAFAIQIYCDFSGYSDIAKGCAKTMGVDLMVNFRAPYLSTSVTEFWKRWHVSLTSWFREYVYIPLGGNRKGTAKRILFVFITFLLSGLWHGADWSFAIWGLLQALAMTLESFLTKDKKRLYREHLSPVLRWSVTPLVFLFACFAWVFFRADSIFDAGYVLSNAFVGISKPLQYFKSAILPVFPGTMATIIIAFSLVALVVFDVCNEKRDVILQISKLSKPIRLLIYVTFLVLLILFIPKEISSAFIYFQF